MNNKNKMNDSTQSFQKQKVMTSTENKVENRKRFKGKVTNYVCIIVTALLPLQALSDGCTQRPLPR